MLIMRRSPVVADGLIGIALAALLLLVHHGALDQIGELDAWVYTGLSLDFRAIAERFGPTYYSLRVAHILPASAFYHLLGLEAGHVGFRLFLISLIFICLATVARGFLPFPLARILAALFVIHPWMFRSLSWDYCDGTGVLYLAVLLVCLDRIARSSEIRDRVVSGFLAGVALAFAANSNLFLIAVGGALGLWPIPVLLSSKNRWSLLGGLAGAGAMGFATGYLVLVAARFLAVPSQGWIFDIFGLGAGSRLIGGGGEVWHQDVLALVQDENAWYTLAPLLVFCLLVIGLLIVGGGSRRPLVLGADIALAVTIAGFCVADFGFKIGVISLNFYFVYAVPATFLAVCAGLSLCARATPPGRAERWLIAASVGMLVAGLAAAEWLAGLGVVWPISAAAIGVLIGICGLVMLLNREKWRWPVVAAIIVPAGLAAQIPFYAGDRFYRPQNREAAGVEWNVYRLGERLFQALASIPRDHHEVGFWYPNLWKDGLASPLDGINGLWLWGYTRVQHHDTESGSGMPELLPEEEARLRQFRRILVLSWDRDQLDRGLATLESRVGIVERASMEFKEGPLNLLAELVQIPDQKALRKQARRQERLNRRSGEPASESGQDND
jgi:hypothetical protein